MHFSYIESIYNLVLLGVHIFVQLVAAVLIYIKRHEPKDRSWRYIFTFFTFSALASVVEMFMIMYNAIVLDFYKLLNPSIIIPGFYIFALLLCYIIELTNPRWLTVMRAIVLFLPSIILAGYVIYYYSIGDITNIYSLARLKALCDTPNVIARITFLSIFVLYSIVLIVVRFQWKRPQVQKYIDALVLFAMLLCVSYILSRGLQIFSGYLLHELLYMLITIGILYFEFYERLHIPLETVRTYYEQPEVPNNTLITVNVVANNLRELMNDDSVWRDPELTADRVVQLVGTNRTYIQHAARELGFANLSDMVHRRRVDYICECLRKDPNANIQNIFWDAGYRSRATAWRNFTNIVGCTPTDFVHRITPPGEYKRLKDNDL